MAQQMAVLGEPSEVDPKDRLNAMGMLRLYGVFPAHDTETAIAVRMRPTQRRLGRYAVALRRSSESNVIPESP